MGYEWDMNLIVILPLEMVILWWFNGDPMGFTRPGELTFCNGKIHHVSWENPLFLWPFSIAMLVHQRV